MDSLTQITLGAAVGEACLGKKLGNKGAAWGAFFGLLPDLDVLANPFVNNVQQLIIHRGISHSLFFSVVAAPLFGWLLYRYYNKEIAWQRWSLMVFLVIITHIFIDACTSYGTQVLQPFSNYPLSFNTIFIIDPFYTVPLLAGIVAALCMNRQSSWRRWVNYAGLAISSVYMLAGFGIKAHVNTVAEENFRQQGLAVERYITTPMPFTEFLWVTYAVADDNIYAGLYSIFDDNRQIPFQQVDMNAGLIEPYTDQLPVERILWFSQGYHAVSRDSTGVYMHDLRFGRSDLWLRSGPAPFVWNYKLQFNPDSTRVTGFRQLEPDFNASSELLYDLIDRIFGKETGTHHLPPKTATQSE